MSEYYLEIGVLHYWGDDWVLWRLWSGRNTT